MSTKNSREQEINTNSGVRTLRIDSQLTSEGVPVAGQDTVGVLYNPSNLSEVRFRLKTDGKQQLETRSGWNPFKKYSLLPENDPMFVKNLSMIRDLIVKYKAVQPAEKSGGRINY